MHRLPCPGQSLPRPDAIGEPGNLRGFCPAIGDGNPRLKVLTHGFALDDRRIDALRAFLRADTDERYNP